jgi:hypothetical protein
MKPTVGRAVHYVAHGTPVREDGTQAFPSVCRAAVVTEVCDNPDGIDPETGTLCVSLVVLNPTGMFFQEHLPQDEQQKRGGSWHWPEREDDRPEFVGATLAAKDLQVELFRSGSLVSAKVTHLPSGLSCSAMDDDALEAKAAAIVTLTNMLSTGGHVVVNGS